MSIMGLNTAAIYISVCLTILAGNAFSQHHHHGHKDCKPQPTDVIFVLDTSDSITENDFKIEIHFVSNITRDLKTISPSGTQIGLYTFSDTFQNNIVLGQYQDKSSLLVAINGITRLHGSTETHLVLEDIIKNGFKGSSRKNTKRSVVFITDGQSIYQSKTYLAAKALHKANIEVHSVGVGSDVDPSELTHIASHKDFMHRVPDFQSLAELEKHMGSIVCEVVKCVTQPTDVIFVLDSSDSIIQTDFEKQIDFLVEVVKSPNMMISSKEAQVGIYTFATGFVMNIALGTYKTKQSLVNAIKNIKRLHGSTNTHLALTDVLQNGFSKAKGARSNVHKVVILITDGQSVYTRDTAKAADALHNNNIEVIPIGVGKDVSETELKILASKYEKLHLVKNYDSLKKALEDHVSKVTCVSQTICKTQPTDVIFAIDSSSSISAADFSIQKKFLIDFVKFNKLIISDSNTHIGVYTFAGNFVKNFQLNSYKTKADIINALNSLTPLNGITNTHLVLEEILKNGFSKSNGARANVNQVVVLISDGEPLYIQKTTDAAADLHHAGIKVYAIGISNATNFPHLKTIASSKETFFHVPNYDTLDLIEQNVNRLICKNVTHGNNNQTHNNHTNHGGSCETGSADVVFLVDTSDSTNKTDLSIEINIITKFVNSLSDLNKVKVALVSFGSKPNLEFSLTTYTSKSSLVSAVKNMKSSSGTTNTAKGLSAAKNALQSGSNKRQVVVIITDGKSDDLYDSKMSADSLHSSGINIIGYGIGKADISELSIISGSMSNVVIGQLGEMTDQLKSKVLNSKCA
ncbi:cartilage matrix protein-like [Argonauta hians]